jgi:hypothetical protein
LHRVVLGAAQVSERGNLSAHVIFCFKLLETAASPFDKLRAPHSDTYRASFYLQPVTAI